MQGNFALRTGAGETPLVVRLGGKLVLEVLPAALASAIGAFLFAQYQFDRAAPAVHATPAVAVPASAEMLQLVREEHAMIRDFLTAQQTAAQNRAVAANAADAAADTAVDATLTAAVPPIVIAGARPAATAAPVLVASAQPAATAPIAAPTGVSASAQPDGSLWPSAPPPAHPSIVAQTLAVPGRVVSVTLHAVMAIGGIPSWLGHRFGDDDMSVVAQSSNSAS